MLNRHVYRAEGVIEHQDSHAGLRTVAQNLLESFGHATGSAVVQLQRDRLLR